MLYYLKYNDGGTEPVKFDYSVEDSLFSNAEKKGQSTEKTIKNVEKRVDSDQELLDFRTPKLSKGVNPTDDLVDKVNINNASIDILKQLPGIGQITAEKIVAFREQNNGFKVVSDLMLVSGIGEAKYNRIKELITIE